MLEQLIQIGYGLLLGSLVGIEREKNTIQLKNMGILGFAGLRSFGLIGLLGSLAGFIDNNAFTIALMMGLLAFIISIYVIANLVKNQYKSGITSELAIIVVFIIGFLAGQGDFFIATSVAVGLTFLLGWKNYLHSIVESMTQDEFESILKFVLISVIILPLLPQTNFGPYEALNLHRLWSLVVLISAISGASYIAIKVVGYKKGLSLGGFLGGLVSSTASTFSFAKMSKDFSQKTENALLTGMMMTSVAMYFRLLLQVSLINLELFKLISIPFAFGGLSLLGIAYGLSRKPESKKFKKVENDIKSPFSIIKAMQFGLLFAVILTIVAVSKQLVGDQVLYLVSMISGLVDTDAITLSLASLSQNGLNLQTASYGIVIAASTNMVAKVIYVWISGSKSIRLRFLKLVSLNVLAVGVGVVLVNVVNVLGM